MKKIKQIEKFENKTLYCPNRTRKNSFDGGKITANFGSLQFPYREIFQQKYL